MARPQEPASPTGDTPPPHPKEAVRELRDLVDLVGTKGSTKKLTDRQLQRMAGLYRAAANRLANTREFGGSSRRTEELNRIVGRAHNILYRKPPRPPFLKTVAFNLLALPAGIRAAKGYHWLAFGLFLLGGVYGYFGAAADPEWAATHLMPDDNRTPFASRETLLRGLHMGRNGEVDAVDKSLFASQLFQNNFKVALYALFFGALGGVPTAFILLTNGVLLGTYTWIHHSKGLAYEWWAWILPHGITEMGAICVLGGAGMWLGHRLLAPGHLRRRDALTAIRPDLFRMVVVAFLCMVFAAGIESFLRQSAMGTPARYVFAGLTLVGWIAILKLIPKPTPLHEEDLDLTTAQRQVAMPALVEILSGSRPRPAR